MKLPLLQEAIFAMMLTYIRSGLMPPGGDSTFPSNHPRVPLGLRR